MHGAEVRDLNVYVKEEITKRIKTLIHFSGPWSTEGTLRLRSGGAYSDYWNEQVTEFMTTTPVRVGKLMYQSFDLIGKLGPHRTLMLNVKQKYQSL